MLGFLVGFVDLFTAGAFEVVEVLLLTEANDGEVTIPVPFSTGLGPGLNSDCLLMFVLKSVSIMFL
jgi:hypothetical protein